MVAISKLFNKHGLNDRSLTRFTLRPFDTNPLLRARYATISSRLKGLYMTSTPPVDLPNNRTTQSRTNRVFPTGTTPPTNPDGKQTMDEDEIFYRRDFIKDFCQPDGLAVASRVTAREMFEKLEDKRYLKRTEIEGGTSNIDIIQEVLFEIISDAVRAASIRHADQNYVGAEVRCRAVVKNNELWLQILDNGNSLSREITNVADKTEILEQLGYKLVIENRTDSEGVCVSVVISLTN